LAVEVAASVVALPQFEGLVVKLAALFSAASAPT